ncbi:hypothetical protein U14_01941 [Candidatus Moduliflexus flocculans]|uniref:Uncharacterized protein n=1 Tax=Candidatus Moduliflexus flocculans TaxID=1499966 RepID=A0A0S6VWS6_9BACT|nr:hypothetical protein U14_01941 [Candidatus Moduliflexus flocculans]
MRIGSLPNEGMSPVISSSSIRSTEQENTTGGYMIDKNKAIEFLQNSSQLVNERDLQHHREMAKSMQSFPSVADTWGSANIYKQIMAQIQEAEQELNSEYDIGISLQLSGGLQNIHIDDIIALPPNLIVFKGRVGTSGESVRLIQHIQQVNLLLIKVKRPEPQTPKRKIGFHFPE